MLCGKNTWLTCNKMDIDEFLDRELQLGKEEAVEEKPASIQVAKEEKDDIKHYFELWNKVSDAKLNWNGNLHAELTTKGKRIKENLNRLLPTVEGEKSAIMHLISKAINELRNGNYEYAIKLYSEINSMRENFPDFFPEEKKALNREIFKLYEQLREEIDSKLIDDAKESIARVDALVRGSFSYLRMGKINVAKKIYEDALKAFIGLPSAFLLQKIELGIGLLTLYKDLSIDAQIKNLQLTKETTEGYSFSSMKSNLSHLVDIKDRTRRQEKASVFSNLRTISQK